MPSKSLVTLTWQPSRDLRERALVSTDSRLARGQEGGGRGTDVSVRPKARSSMSCGFSPTKNHSTVSPNRPAGEHSFEPEEGETELGCTFSSSSGSSSLSYKSSSRITWQVEHATDFSQAAAVSAVSSPCDLRRSASVGVPAKTAFPLKFQGGTGGWLSDLRCRGHTPMTRRQCRPLRSPRR